jgi:integrase
MKKERKKGKSFVSGRKGAYEIQPPIEHPADCKCASSLRLPKTARDVAHVIRLRRRSPFPADLQASAHYARDLKAQLEIELRAAHGQSGAGPLSLPQLCELYFSKNPRSVSAATIERDCITAVNLCALLPAHVRPDEIGEPEAVDYRNARQSDGARPRTILNELSFLRSLLRFGYKWKKVTGMQGVQLDTVPDVGEWESDGVALTKDEFKAVLRVLSETNRRRMIFGVTTMLRRTPLLAMKKAWIDRGKAWLSVPAEMMKKGRSRRRTGLEVPLSSWALEQTKDVDGNAHGYLWPARMTGTPLTRVRDIFADCVAASGVREFSCHDLRTTGATWLRDEGVDELVIAILLGHRSTYDRASGSFHAPGGNVTRLYTRVYESAMREAVAVFDRIREEIDPVSTADESDVEFESAAESAESRMSLNYWNQTGYVVAHTGFEPVLPP